MRRLHLFEWEDQPWFPHLWRNYMTDVLQFTLTLLAPRMPVLRQLLNRLFDRMRADQIVDLCSGSSGLLLWVRQRLEEERGHPVSVLLTDKFPNLAAFEVLRAASGGRVGFRADSIDATTVPDDLAGVRTMFLALHHFPPEVARSILGDAARKRRAIAVFEFTERSVKALILSVTFPLVVLVVTPFLRPLRWRRLFWTYVIPVVPLATWWDGFVSCLRTYTPRELEEMAAGVGAADYVWECGRAPVEGTLAQITYLIGYPLENSGAWR